MAAFEMKCPHCGTAAEVQSEWIGMEVECSICKKNFTVEKKPELPQMSLPPKKQTASAGGAENQSAAFEMKCPHCSTAAEVQSEWIGMEVECPLCKKTFTVEKKPAAPKHSITLPKEAARVKPATQSPATFTFICPECDTSAELPIELKGQKYECKSCCETHIALPAEDRNCPFCGKKIKIKATICKHCKRKINDRLNHSENTPPKKTSKPASRIPFYGWACIGLVCLVAVLYVFFVFSYCDSADDGTVKVNVTVTKWLAGYGASWKWGCEYRLFADDQLIASKNTKDMSVTFYVRVRRGAVLRGEMYPRNGFGATESLQGTSTVIAGDSGEDLHIECR